MVSKGLRCGKMLNTLKSKVIKEKLKLAFMIYADFESILKSVGNGKQNPDNPYTNNFENLLLAVMVIN